MSSWEVITGDCLDVMPTLEANSVDTIITDPPAAIAFMGKSWDGDRGGRAQWVAWLTKVMAEGLRVLKPGGMALVWALPRTSHWTAMAVEDAGFEIREKIYHIFGSGFPKSHQFSKRMNGNGADWQGYGTALKPAAEEWIVAMKPLDGTFAENAQRWGVAGYWIDGGRVGTGDDKETGGCHGSIFGNNGKGAPVNSQLGRWPANVIHDGSDEVLAGFPVTTSGVFTKRGNVPSAFLAHPNGVDVAGHTGGDTGSAARFFYCAKASRSERNAGLEGLEAQEKKTLNDYRLPSEGRTAPKNGTPQQNHHPTVKPLALMRYLARLTKTPTGGVVLDPFAGSGSTGCAAVLEGRSFIGIEQDAEYADIARRRIAHWQEQGAQLELL